MDIPDPPPPPTSSLLQLRSPSPTNTRPTTANIHALLPQGPEIAEALSKKDKCNNTLKIYYNRSKFWLVSSLGNKDYMKEMNKGNSVLLSLLMSSNLMCNTGHAP